MKRLTKLLFPLGLIAALGSPSLTAGCAMELEGENEYETYEDEHGDQQFASAALPSEFLAFEQTAWAIALQISYGNLSIGSLWHHLEERQLEALRAFERAGNDGGQVWQAATASRKIMNTLNSVMGDQVLYDLYGNGLTPEERQHFKSRLAALGSMHSRTGFPGISNALGGFRVLQMRILSKFQHLY